MSENSSNYAPSQAVISIRRDPYEEQNTPLTRLANDEPFYIVVARPSNAISDDPRTVDVTIQAKDGGSTRLILKDTGIFLDERHLYSTEKPVWLSHDGEGGAEEVQEDPVLSIFERPSVDVGRLPIQAQGEITISYEDGSEVTHLTLTAFDQSDRAAPALATQAAVVSDTQPVKVKPSVLASDTQPIKVKAPAAVKADEMAVTPFAEQDQPSQEPAMQPVAPFTIPVTGPVEGEMAMPLVVEPVTDAPSETNPGDTARTQIRQRTSETWPIILRGMLVGAAIFLIGIIVVYGVYNFGRIPGFSNNGEQLPAAVVAATPVENSSPTQAAATPVGGSKPSSADQPLAANSSPTQVDATPTSPAVVANLNAPVIDFNFDQTQLSSFTIQLADLVVLDPSTIWGEVSNSRNLADWATAGTAQALSGVGEQHMSGAGFRSQSAAKGTAMVTSTVHEFASVADAQKGIQIMTVDAKTTLGNAQVTQTSLTLSNEARAPVTLVTGSQGTGTYVFFIASYNNMVVNVSTGGFDSSSTGLEALVNDCKTLGQQMLNRISGAAPLQ